MNARRRQRSRNNSPRANDLASPARSSQIRSTVERSTSGGARTARSTPPRLTNIVATTSGAFHCVAANSCTLGARTTCDRWARGSVSLNSSTHEPPQQPFEAWSRSSSGAGRRAPSSQQLASTWTQSAEHRQNGSVSPEGSSNNSHTSAIHARCAASLTRRIPTATVARVGQGWRPSRAQRKSGAADTTERLARRCIDAQHASAASDPARHALRPVGARRRR